MTGLASTGINALALCPSSSMVFGASHIQDKTALTKKSSAGVISSSDRSSEPSCPPSSASSGARISSRSQGVEDIHTADSTDGGDERKIESNAPAAISALITGTDEPPSKLSVDVVVVGSGAGGGCAAGVLASKGFKVAVLEKGGLYDRADFSGFSEMEAYRRMYERQVCVPSRQSHPGDP